MIFNEEKKGSLFLYESNSTWKWCYLAESTTIASKVYALKPCKTYFFIFDEKIHDRAYFYIISEKDPCERCWVHQSESRYFENYLRKISS